MAITWTQPVLSTPDVRAVNLDVSSLPKKATQEETFPVPDLLVTDHVEVLNPQLQAGVTILDARVSSVDTLAITFWNQTNVAVDLVAQDFTLLVSRGT